MNKKELVEKIESLPSLTSITSIRPYVDKKIVLGLISQLDEPETGHADEAPRYVKNILARLRELQEHDREVWLKAIMGEFERDFSRAKWREGYEQGKFEGEWVGQQLKDADKIRQELNKPVIPQFVADWIEEKRDKGWKLSQMLLQAGLNKQYGRWVVDNQDTFARAWLDGYEVKKESKYIVKVKGLCENHETLNREKNSKKWIVSNWEENSLYKTKHTRKELEEAGFGWVFDCPAIEIEEVEDE